MTTTGAALKITDFSDLDAFFLVLADFSENATVSPQDSDPIWIKGADGEVDCLTYAEFRNFSRKMLGERSLPDGTRAAQERITGMEKEPSA